MTMEATQIVACSMNLILERQCDASKNEPIDTSTSQRDEKLKSTCNWCGYKSHFKCECRQKVTGRPKKVSPSNTLNTSCDFFKCFCCGREDYHVADCKAKVVFSAEEFESKINKNKLSYLEIYREKGVVGRLSEIRSVLQEEKRKSSHGNDSLSFSKSILSPVSKLTILPSDTDRLSEMVSVL
jgi:hypothetical protein